MTEMLKQYPSDPPAPPQPDFIDNFEGFSFRDVLKKHVESREDWNPTRLSPSGLGKCARSQIYGLNKIAKTTGPDEAALINFIVGDVWEEVIKRALDEQGVKYDYQMQLRDKELNLSGRPDFVVHLKQGLLVSDSKTMRSQWFWYLTHTNKDFLKENPDYEYQLGSYMVMAKRKGMPLFRGQFPFVSKDDGMIWREVGIHLTPELEKRVIDRCNYLNEWLRSGKLPPCECGDSRPQKMASKEGVPAEIPWKICYCDYGDVHTQAKNKKGKVVNTRCCMEELWEQRTPYEFPEEEEEKA